MVILKGWNSIDDTQSGWHQCEVTQWWEVPMGWTCKSYVSQHIVCDQTMSGLPKWKGKLGPTTFQLFSCLFLSTDSSLVLPTLSGHSLS